MGNQTAGESGNRGDSESAGSSEAWELRVQITSVCVLRRRQRAVVIDSERVIRRDGLAEHRETIDTSRAVARARTYPSKPRRQRSHGVPGESDLTQQRQVHAE